MCTIYIFNSKAKNIYGGTKAPAAEHSHDITLTENGLSSSTVGQVSIVESEHS